MDFYHSISLANFHYFKILHLFCLFIYFFLSTLTKSIMEFDWARAVSVLLVQIFENNWASLMNQQAKNLPAMQETQRCRFDPWVRKIPWRMKWQPIPVCLPIKSHGQRRLAGYISKGCKESDTTEHNTAKERYRAEIVVTLQDDKQELWKQAHVRNSSISSWKRKSSVMVSTSLLRHVVTIE